MSATDPSSPSGRPWLVWRDFSFGLAKGKGLDAGGRWWVSYGAPALLMYGGGPLVWNLPPSAGFVRTKVSPVEGALFYTDVLGAYGLVFHGKSGYATASGPGGDEGSFLDRLGEVVRTTVMPIILATLTTLNPAVGAAASAIYSGAIKLAAGMPITTVAGGVLDQVKSQLPSILSGNEFQKAYDAVLTDPNAAALRAGLDEVLMTGDRPTIDAYRAGAILANAKSIQDRAVSILREKVPEADRGTFDVAVANGASITDLATGLLGVQAGIRAKTSALAAASKEIGAPSLSSSSSSSSSGGKSGGKSGGSLVSLGVLAVLGFVAYRIVR